MSPKIVLVTGANTGLGLEIIRALYCSSQTYTIFVGSRSLDGAETAITELKSQYSGKTSTFEAIQVDVEDDVSIAAALDTVEKRFGVLDILVNNAGMSLRST